MMADNRWYPTTRQFTGTPYVFRAYAVRNGEVIGCPHRHHSIHIRGRHVSGQVFAMRCAEELARKFNRSLYAALVNEQSGKRP
jgi:hypothetical protein